jgi:hypothetical protein
MRRKKVTGPPWASVRDWFEQQCSVRPSERSLMDLAEDVRSARAVLARAEELLRVVEKWESEYHVASLAMNAAENVGERSKRSRARK